MDASVFLTAPEITERTLYKNELVFAFLTNIPIVPGHTLIIPVRQVKTAYELTKEEFSAIIDAAKILRRALEKTFGATGFNYAWNENVIAGQSVPHFHLHMLPRKDGDSGVWQYDPRKFIYRPGSREASPEAELKSISELIKSNL
jgi:histidine triad (HIT) family protein